MERIENSDEKFQLDDDKLDKLDRLLISISKENIDAKNEFLMRDITNDNQLDIKIYAQYDSTMMANAILNALNMLGIKFSFNYEMGSLSINRAEKYYVTNNMVLSIGNLIGKNFESQIANIRLYMSTRERDCLKFEIKVLECIDTFFGYMKTLYCLGYFSDPIDKCMKKFEEGDDETVSESLRNFDTTRNKTRDFIVKRLKNYNLYLKALVKIEEAKDELKYQARHVLNLEKYKERVDECEKVLDTIKAEYAEIDRLDREFGNSIVKRLHGDFVR